VTSGMGAVSTSAIPNLCSETLTDGAGSFLPGVPLGCLHMWDQDHVWEPRPGRMRSKGRGDVRHTRQPHAGIQRRAIAARSWAELDQPSIA